ncbi:MAG: STM4013/SEN3800 family hydrolase [Alcanivoracaceae bacterium]|nr:STM4013/SEN3800 family hydrolase [Alcanivoracaceae bacterium]
MIDNKDVVWLVLDALRYDVAKKLFEEKKLPNISKLLPTNGWQHCHSPANFTYPAHQAFFSGFLPTPIDEPKAPRLFAAEFLGSETSNEDTYIFEEANVIESFKNNGYRTICIGGVGFFNKQTKLSQVLPDLFDESYWKPEFSVIDKNSCCNQFNFAQTLIEQMDIEERFLLFINISAIHQPNNFYIEGQDRDNLDSHAEALKYVDAQLPILFKALKNRNIFGILCSDHGTAYGEDGYWGHRNSHSTVMEVPYRDFEKQF